MKQWRFNIANNAYIILNTAQFASLKRLRINHRDHLLIPVCVQDGPNYFVCVKPEDIEEVEQ